MSLSFPSSSLGTPSAKFSFAGAAFAAHQHLAGVTPPLADVLPHSRFGLGLGGQLNGN